MNRNGGEMLPHSCYFLQYMLVLLFPVR